jgi:hypothetical protein
MSGATTDGDRLRLALDDILAAQCETREHLFVAITRLAQRARTREEAEILRHLIHARTALGRAHQAVTLLHVDGRKEHPNP